MANKEVGTAVPTSVGLADRQMSLSLHQVNRLSQQRIKKKRADEINEVQTDVCRYGTLVRIYVSKKGK